MLEPFLVALAAPLLIFPNGPLPWIGLALVLLSWCLRGLATGAWLVRTRLDLPILVLLLMLPVSLYPSVDLSLSLPKFYGILLGIFVFYTVVSSVSRRRKFWLGVGLLIGCIWAVSMVGLVGTDWSDWKYSWLQRFYALAPRLITVVQTSMGTTSGIHPNELGGTLGFLLPIPLALLIGGQVTVRYKAILGATVLLGFAVLALSGSRSAITGLFVSLIVLVVWRVPFFRKGAVRIVLALAVVALGGLVALRGPDVVDARGFIGVSDAISGKADFATREEIWTRARYMIEDFPFTGIGLNNFDVVLNNLYPLPGGSPDRQLAHAHNVFLQTTLDLGLGGLVGFLGLCATAAYAGLRSYRRLLGERSRFTSFAAFPFEKRDITGQRGGPSRSSVTMGAAVVGMVTGLLSFLVFGLTDAVALGAKPTVLLWVMMGLIVVGGRLSHRRSTDRGQVSGAGDRVADSSNGSALSKPRSSIFFPSPSSIQRCLDLLQTAYGPVTLLLVGMGYLVVVMGVSGWRH